MRALIWKELRENVRWLPIGLLVVTAVGYLVLPSIFTFSQSMVARDLLAQLAIIAPLLAFALGVVQSFRDLKPASGAYLNHRGVTRSDVFLAKTIVGFLLYAIAIVVPLTALAAWIAAQGMQWYPMRPAQVLPSLAYALAAFGMHPAAMLMMARDASWWGTRLLPLVPIAIAVFVIWTLSKGLMWAAICAILAVPVLTWVVATARQGWCDLVSDPSATKYHLTARGRCLLPLYLTAGAVGALFVSLMFGIAILEYWRRGIDLPEPFNAIAVERESKSLWMVTNQYKYDRVMGITRTNVLGGDPVVQGGQVNPLKPVPDGLGFDFFSHLTPTDRGVVQSDGFFTPLSMIAAFSDETWYSFDQRGYVLLYGAAAGRFSWKNTVAADHIHSAGILSGVPFTADPIGLGALAFSTFREAGLATPLVDSKGVYLLEDQPLSIRTLIAQPVDAIGLVTKEAGAAPSVLIRAQSQLFEYEMVDGTGSTHWFPEVDGERGVTRITVRPLRDLSLSAKLVQTYDLPPELAHRSELSIASAADGGWFLTSSASKTTVFKVAPQGDTLRLAFTIEPGTSSPPSAEDRIHVLNVLFGLCPGVMYLIGTAIAGWVSFSQPFERPFADLMSWVADHPVQTTAGVVAFVLVSLTCVMLTIRASRQRGLSRRPMLLWCWSVGLLGLAAPLSVLAIYRNVHREACSRCERPRRVDLELCENCGAGWDLPTIGAIEITDEHRSPQAIASEVLA